MEQFRCFLSVLFLPMIFSISFETDDDAHGLRIFMNEQYIVGAFNIYAYYLIEYLIGPMSTSTYNICHPYLADDRQKYYIYSISGMSMIDNETIRFVQLAEDTTSLDVVLSVVQTTCFHTSYVDTIICQNCHQQYLQIEIDSQEKYAYIMADSFLLSYDLVNNTIIQNFTFGDIVLSQTRERIFFRSFVITDQWAFVTGYLVSPWSDSFGFYCVTLFALQPEIYVAGGNVIFTERTYNVQMIQYNRPSNLPISLDRSTGLIAIGIPSINKIIFCQVIPSEEDSWQISMNTNLPLMNTDSNSISEFGRSIAWIESGKLAVVIGKYDQSIWSYSQLRVYSNVTFQNSRRHPDFVLPNHQQVFLNINTNTNLLDIFLVLTKNQNLLLLNSDSSLYYVPPSPPGACSIIQQEILNTPLYHFEWFPCIRGTFRNETSLGPCTVCPSNTMNSGNDTIRCRLCMTDAFCPLGASGEVDLKNVSSYTQIATYPDSPDINNIDDYLLINFLTIDMENKAKYCLLMSPLFWIILISVICVIIWLIMFILKQCSHRWPTSTIHRKQIKSLFKHTDIIGSGERWIGGLASVIILVLIGILFWIALTYLNLYPIEIIPFDIATCQGDIRNTQFDNALQLPLADIHGERWPIFDMLNEQDFTMSVDLINIAQPLCKDISIQWTRVNVRSVNLPIRNCTLSKDNTTLSFRFLLPTHRSSIKLDIIGAYFLGAVRFCLHGDARTENNIHRLHHLDTCTLFYTDNQTIGLVTDFTVKLIKVINQTKPLRVGDDNIIDGRWGTTMSTDALSDELIFEQNGQYLRYISDRTILKISFFEESYFLLNNQRPIVRITELVFHTLLFIFTIIDLFTTVFLIYKLCYSPISHIGRVLPSKFRKSDKRVARQKTSLQT
ncbi:hypothetical protein I4U23_001373 [Adineta vaga]|nr:hypothetical protein I4U23_001373 [Adineta vaga]